MDGTVNTNLSNKDEGFTIRCIAFQSIQNEIDAKKLVTGKRGILPKCSKAKPTYLIKNIKNEDWERCEKVGNKLRRIPGATIINETKKSRLSLRMDKKYEEKEVSKIPNIKTKKSSAKITRSKNNDKEVI